jgi:hypothetical protein
MNDRTTPKAKSPPPSTRKYRAPDALTKRLDQEMLDNLNKAGEDYLKKHDLPPLEKSEK